MNAEGQVTRFRRAGDEKVSEVDVVWIESHVNDAIDAFSERDWERAGAILNCFYEEVMKHSVKDVMQIVMTDQQYGDFVVYVQNALVEPCENSFFIVSVCRIVHLFSLMKKDLVVKFCNVFTMNGVLSMLDNPFAGSLLGGDMRMPREQYCEMCKYLLSSLYNFVLALDLGQEEVDNVMSVVCRIFPKLQKSEAMKFWILVVVRMLSIHYNCINEDLLESCWCHGLAVINQGLAVPSDSFLILEVFIHEDVDFVARRLTGLQLSVIIDQNVASPSERHSSLGLQLLSLMLTEDPRSQQVIYDILDKRAASILEIVSSPESPNDLLVSFSNLCRDLLRNGDHATVEFMQKHGFLEYLTRLCHCPVFAVSNSAIEAILSGFPIFSDSVIQFLVAADFLPVFSAHIECVEDLDASLAAIERIFACSARGTIDRATASTLIPSIENIPEAASILATWHSPD